MAKQTLIGEGCFTKAEKDICNANFVELYANTPAPVVVTDSSLTLTAATHGYAVIVQNAAGGCAFTLPAATGTGVTFEIITQVTNTSSTTVATSPTTDYFIGMAWVMSDNSQAVLAFLPASTSNLLTLDGSTTGGYLGHRLLIKDVAAARWEIQSFGKATGSEATPFSHV